MSGNIRGSRAWRCSILLAFLLSVYAFNFIRNRHYIGTFQSDIPVVEEDRELYHLSTSKDIMVVYGTEAVRIEDCYRLNKNERLELMAYVYPKLKDKTDRSLYSLEGELAFHVYCYQYGIKKASAKDADLDYGKEKRWYVAFASSILQMLGV